MQTLLDLSPGYLTAAILGLTFGFALVIHMVTEHGPLRERLRDYRSAPVAALTAVAVLFGLFAAFLGADIWDRIREERQSLEREIAAVQTIDAIAEGLGQQGVRIEQRLKSYVAQSVPDMIVGSDRSKADNALDELVRAVLDLSHADTTHGPSRSAILVAYHEIKMARAERLHLQGTHSDPLKWLAVFLMGLLTQVSIAFSTPDNPKGQAAGLVIFTLAFAVTLVSLAIHETPLAYLAKVPVETLTRSVGP